MIPLLQPGRLQYHGHPFAQVQPLRARVQRAIDRRFHRAQYDAERTVAAFAGRLRDEIDLATLTRDLRSTAESAIETRGSAVWLADRR